jgi:hypothetical protein
MKKNVLIAGLLFCICALPLQAALIQPNNTTNTFVTKNDSPIWVIYSNSGQLLESSLNRLSNNTIWDQTEQGNESFIGSTDSTNELVSCSIAPMTQIHVQPSHPPSYIVTMVSIKNYVTDTRQGRNTAYILVPFISYCNKTGQWIDGIQMGSITVRENQFYNHTMYGIYSYGAIRINDSNISMKTCVNFYNETNRELLPDGTLVIYFVFEKRIESPVGNVYFDYPPYNSFCGDANGDYTLDISDVVFLISHIFSGGAAPNPVCKGDANGDGSIDISDAVYLISRIFSGGPAPVADCCG